MLNLEQIPVPQPKADEILIRVRAVETTKADCEMRSFNYSVKWFWLPLRLAFGIRKPKRRVLGSYFSGEVVGKGEDVERFEINDAVYGSAQLRLGAYAEYMTLPASYPIAPKPKNMSFTEAAAVPLGGMNALHFINMAKLKAGESILVNGAGGVIGGYAVQMAKARGAVVTGVDAGIKEHVVRQFGADEFINYEQQDFTKQETQYDVIFNMVPACSYSASLKRLNPNGRYLSGNPRLSVMLRAPFTTRFTDKESRFAFAPENKKVLIELKEMIERGEIGAIVDQALPMEEVKEAHTLVETEQRLGAIVITI